MREGFDRAIQEREKGRMEAAAFIEYMRIHYGPKWYKRLEAI